MMDKFKYHKRDVAQELQSDVDRRSSSRHAQSSNSEDFRAHSSDYEETGPNVRRMSAFGPSRGDDDSYRTHGRHVGKGKHETSTGEDETYKSSEGPITDIMSRGPGRRGLTPTESHDEFMRPRNSGLFNTASRLDAPGLTHNSRVVRPEYEGIPGNFGFPGGKNQMGGLGGYNAKPTR